MYDKLEILELLLSYQNSEMDLDEYYDLKELQASTTTPSFVD